MANKTVISNMVMRLQIWIIDIYSTYALHTHKDAIFHLSSWLFSLAKFPIFCTVSSAFPEWVQFCEEVNENPRPLKKKATRNYIFRVAFFIYDWIIFSIPKMATGF
jgi:hypothetical protein